MTNLPTILETAGLNTKEAALYLAALNLGDAPMSRLAKEAKLKRSSAYQIFKELERRGIMGSFKMRNGLRFAATSPSALYATRKKELGELEAVLPELRALESKKGARPKISYFEGQEGYRLALEDSLQKPGNVLRYIGSLMETYKTVGEEYDITYYVPTRIQKNISIKALLLPDLREDLKKREHKEELREIKWLPEKYQFEGSTLIYDHKVVIVSGAEEMITVVIESESIAEAEKQKFELLWQLIPL